MSLRLRLMLFGALCIGMVTCNTRCANATCRRAPDSSMYPWVMPCSWAAKYDSGTGWPSFSQALKVRHFVHLNLQAVI